MRPYCVGIGYQGGVGLVEDHVKRWAENMYTKSNIYHCVDKPNLLLYTHADAIISAKNIISFLVRQLCFLYSNLTPTLRGF